MKTILTATAVLALSAGAAMADKIDSKMADPKPEPRVYEPAPAAYDWTGAYGGLSLSYGRSSHAVPGAGTLPNATGLGAGGLIGYNWQTGDTVLGAEVAGELSRASGSAPCSNPAWECGSEINNVVSARLRAGVLAAENTLLFATGGVASASITHSTEMGGNTFEDTNRVNGLMIGAGIEHALASGWHVRGDLEHYRFRRSSYNLDVPYNNTRATMNKARMSVIFRF